MPIPDMIMPPYCFQVVTNQFSFLVWLPALGCSLTACDINCSRFLLEIVLKVALTSFKSLVLPFLTPILVTESSWSTLKPAILFKLMATMLGLTL